MTPILQTNEDLLASANETAMVIGADGRPYVSDGAQWFQVTDRNQVTSVQVPFPARVLA